MRIVSVLVVSAVVLVAPGVSATHASRLENKAVEIGPGITPPPANIKFVAETPQGVAESDSHAAVKVRMIVDTHGQVSHAQALDAPDPRLADAATAFFEKSYFQPAKEGTKPVVVWWTGKVSFRPKAEMDAEIPADTCVPSASDVVMGPEELTEDDELPRLIKKVEPVYSPASIRDSGDQKVLFDCVIDTCGRVGNCRVMTASLGAFARASQDAVVQWRYTPLRRGGKPAAMHYTIKFTVGLR